MKNNLAKVQRMHYFVPVRVLPATILLIFL